MKFCKCCGLMERYDNLRRTHFKYCQPAIKKSESGYLIDGHLPKDNVNDFMCLLQMVGIRYEVIPTPNVEERIV
jgi:hypothetical protein